MSEKCNFCGGKIFDEKGQDYGFQMASGKWVCFDDDCLFSCVQNLDMQLIEAKNFIRTRNVVCTWCGFMVVYDNEDETTKQAARDAVNAHALVCEKDPRTIQLKQVETNYDALQTPMPCGHLARYAVNGEEGTQYCVMCHVSNLDGTIDVLHKTLHEIALGLDECEGCTCEMGNAPNGQPYHAIGCTETLAIIARKAIGEQ